MAVDGLDNDTLFDMKDDIMNNIQFINQVSDLHVIEYVHRLFNMDYINDKNYLLHKIYENCAEIQTIKHAQKHLGMTVENFRSFDNRIVYTSINYACSEINNNMKVIYFLHKSLGYTKEDFSICDNYAIRKACETECSNLLKYLIMDIKFNNDDFQKINVSDYINENTRLDTIQLLTDNGIIINDVGKYTCNVLSQLKHEYDRANFNTIKIYNDHGKIGSERCAKLLDYIRNNKKQEYDQRKLAIIKYLETTEIKEQLVIKKTRKEKKLARLAAKGEVAINI